MGAMRGASDRVAVVVPWSRSLRSRKRLQFSRVVNQCKTLGASWSTAESSTGYHGTMLFLSFRSELVRTVLRRSRRAFRSSAGGGLVLSMAAVGCSAEAGSEYDPDPMNYGGGGVSGGGQSSLGGGAGAQAIGGGGQSSAGQGTGGEAVAGFGAGGQGGGATGGVPNALGGMGGDVASMAGEGGAPVGGDSGTAGEGVGGAAAGGAGLGGEAGAGGGGPDVWDEVYPLLVSNCGGAACHDQDHGGFSLQLTRPFIENSAPSLLASIEAGRMPKMQAWTSQEDKQTVIEWASAL